MFLVLVFKQCCLQCARCL